MARPNKLLLDNESVIASVRTHAKVLWIPFVLGLAAMLAAGFAVGAAGGSGDGLPRLMILVIAAVALLIVTVIPFLRWITWNYTLTDKRLIEQRGILTRTGRVIPLSRINDVAFEKGIVDRMLGCGTLVIHDASHQEGLRLHDIPKIEGFHRAISQFVLATHEPEARRDELR